LGVVRETFAFSAAPDDDYVIVKYTLTNPGSGPVGGLHVGEIHDVDLGYNVLDNSVEFVATDELTRVTSPSTATVTGHVLLSHPVTSYRSWANVGGGDGDPQTLGEWFEYLSDGIFNPGPQGPHDIRALLTTGPLGIPPGESLVLATALLGGDGAEDLSTNVAAARAKYAGLPAAALAPYPMIKVNVAVVGGTVDLSDPSDVEVDFTFEDAAQAANVDVNTLVYDGVPAISATISGAVITATFQKSDFWHQKRGQDIGEKRVIGAGKLTDGTLFLGVDFPTFVRLVAPVTRLTFDPAADLTPTWSPDGSRIAFQSNRDGAFAIWIMDVAEGEASAQSLTDGWDDFAPDWYGSTIAFGRFGDTGFEVWSVDDAGGGEVRLASGPRNPRYSPDGSRLAVVIDGDIWVMPATGDLAEAKQLTSDPGLEYQPAWGADGSDLYFTVFPAVGIFKVDALGGSPMRVTPVENSDNRHAALSPDGLTLAFVSRSPARIEIVLQDLCGKHTIVNLDPPLRNIQFTGSEFYQNLEFSPDGTRLLFAAGGTIYSDIYFADLPSVLPLQRVEQIIALVQHLLDDGVLRHGEGNGLIKKLEDAIKLLDQGKVLPAKNKLGDLIDQVQGLIVAGKLSPEQGQPLIGTAQAVLDQLCT
jgi:hypothetical protein